MNNNASSLVAVKPCFSIRVLKHFWLEPVHTKNRSITHIHEKFKVEKGKVYHIYCIQDPYNSSGVWFVIEVNKKFYGMHKNSWAGKNGYHPFKDYFEIIV